VTGLFYVLHPGVTVVRAAILEKVAGSQAYGITQADVARGLLWSQPVVSTHLAWLAAEGLVRKPRQATGRTLCTLTDAGMGQHLLAQRVHRLLLENPTLRPVLVTVDACPGYTATEIAHRLRLAASSLSRPLQRLEEAGLVERRRREGQIHNHSTGAGHAQVPLLPPLPAFKATS
jgi:DNA-binding MarR family transcriptional regulator